MGYGGKMEKKRGGGAPQFVRKDLEWENDNCNEGVEVKTQTGDELEWRRKENRGDIHFHEEVE